ncbi:MAG TPA: SDR family oxidoreductase [Rectinemataceae bacterium]|nr:SDR family oxidoreductase [Rectinemataceae bacterium]
MISNDLLEGKVAVVTGASRGLGLAIARALADAGAAVCLGSRSAAATEAAVAALIERGAKAVGMACDVSDFNAIEALAEFAESAFGPIDIWINNAGLSAPYGPTAHLPMAAMRAVVDTNIVGTMNGSVVAMRHFVPRGRGKLVNILGRGDKGSVPLQNSYSSSKAWVRNFTRALAKEYSGSGVGVFAFNPGLVRTDMLSKVEALRGFGEKMKALAVVTALWGNAAEIPAARIVDLLSPRTDGRTGKEARVLTAAFMFRRTLAGLWRMVSGRGLGTKELEIGLVEPPPGL